MMKLNELAVFQAATAVATACCADNRPKPEQATPERVAGYVSEVLELVFNYSGIDFIVRPLKYPKASKVPVIIEMFETESCLFWYYPYADDASVAQELSGAMSNAMLELMGFAEQGGAA